MQAQVSLLTVSVVALALQASETSAFQVAEPRNGAVIRPGDALKVKVAIPHGLPVVRVTLWETPTSWATYAA